MSKEEMKLILEALENSIDLVEEDYDNAVSLYGNYPSRAKRLIGMETMRDDHRKAITALREALAKPDFWEGYVPEPDKRQQALDKMAENARELGLDYEPTEGTQVSKVWWDGEKLMAKPIPLEDFYEPAQQEPVSTEWQKGYLQGVAEQEEKYKWDIHSCGPTCQRYACVAIREAVEAEREACAKVCEERLGPTATDFYGKTYATTIRARSNT